MQAILVLIPLLFSFFCRAENPVAKMDPAATYTKDLELTADFPSYIEKAFANRALDMVVRRPNSQPLGPLAVMSRIFISRKYARADKKVALAMAGLQVSPSVKYDVIYAHPLGYVVHFHTPQGAVAVFFRGFTLETVHDIQSEIVRFRSAAVVKRMDRIVNLFMPRAWAEELPAVCGGPVHRAKDDATVLQVVLACGSGLWAGTGGLALSVANGAKGLVMDPEKTLKAAVDSIDNMVTVMSDLRNGFGPLREAFDKIPAADRAAFFCEVFSAIPVEVLISYFSAGLASPLVTNTVTSALKKIPTAASLVKTVGGQAKKILEAQQVLARTAKGNEVVKTVEKFDAALNKLNAAQKTLADSKAAPGSEEFKQVMHATRDANRYALATDPAIKNLILTELQTTQNLSDDLKKSAKDYLVAHGCDLTPVLAAAKQPPPPKPKVKFRVQPLYSGEYPERRPYHDQGPCSALYEGDTRPTASPEAQQLGALKGQVQQRYKDFAKCLTTVWQKSKLANAAEVVQVHNLWLRIRTLPDGTVRADMDPEPLIQSIKAKHSAEADPSVENAKNIEYEIQDQKKLAQCYANTLNTIKLPTPKVRITDVCWRGHFPLTDEQRLEETGTPATTQ